MKCMLRRKGAVVDNNALSIAGFVDEEELFLKNPDYTVEELYNISE